MLKAYGISDKRELFRSPGVHQSPYQSARTRNTQDRFERLAGYYDDTSSTLNPSSSGYSGTFGSSNSNESVVRNAIMQFGDVLLRCMQPIQR